MTYKELDALLQGRNKLSKKVDNNTYAERRGDKAIAIKLHATDILTFHKDGKVVVTSGGWKTPTTKDRINNFTPRGINVWQTKGSWFWSGGAPFTDGDVIRKDGTIKAQKKDDSKDQKLRKQIRAYAKLYTEALPMEPPSSGDCWYCSMHTQEGKSLGESFKDTGHLLSHMEEKYVVPSLALTAMKAAGFGDFLIAGAFREDMASFTKGRIAKAVSRYLYAQFGLCR